MQHPGLKRKCYRMYAISMRFFKQKWLETRMDIA
jgi:hypothetical protein